MHAMIAVPKDVHYMFIFRNEDTPFVYRNLECRYFLNVSPLLTENSPTMPGT